ncbi:PilW family protein [uncultured Thiodictyon sp.]|uniref:PilW family protein n=1 Tax=uncultured Thiodictyon sp. TaxID=1846217 RepID=UPI0025DFF445|nr:PilW family protein [uncultured Thiodictyon sp.]
MNALDVPAIGTIRCARSALGPPRGLTLVELMIALALSLLLIAAVGAVYLGSNQTYRAEQDGARIQEAGRYVLDVIGRSLRLAGYTNIAFNQAVMMTGFTGTAVLGADQVCAAGDIVTIQYDGPGDQDDDGHPDDDMQDCQANGIAAENDVAGDHLGRPKIVQHTIFIRDATLRCDAVQTSPTETRYPPKPPTTCPATDAGAPLLDNVEDLQVLYGIDSNDDQSADSYTATPVNWTTVVTVRVCVLVRSEIPGGAPAGQTYFNCSGALGTAANDETRFTPATDTRLRRAFVATFALRNRITRIP